MSDDKQPVIILPGQDWDKIACDPFWPDDYDYPYGKKCSHCQTIGKIENGVCSACGASFRTVECPKCHEHYGEVWNQFGGGCPVCQEKAKREAELKEREESVAAWAEAGFPFDDDNFYDLGPGELESIARDWKRDGWVDGTAHEMVGKLLKEVFRLRKAE